MILRYYQNEAIDALYTYFRMKGGDPVIALPTGTGKSLVIAALLQRAFLEYPYQRVLVLTHVKELIQQNYDELLAVWPTAPAGINSAGLKQRDTLQRIIYAGIASVYRRAVEFQKIDLVIIDEAHLVSPSADTMYRTFIDALKEVNPHLRVVGLTATPWRIGQGRITEEGGLFTDVAYDCTSLDAFNRLIAEGYLAPLIPRRTGAKLDVTGVHMRNGDFVLAELQHAVDKASVTRKAVEEAIQLASDRKHWLVFASGVEHAEHVAQKLNEMGIAAGCVHSRMEDDRDAVLTDFKQGKLRAIVNNNVLTTGFNFPGIDAILMLRPTASPGLWVQMLGRGTRPAPGKENCLVLDFAGNTQRLGPINDPVLPNPKGKGGGEAPVKICPECESYNHTLAKRCVFCDHEFVFKHKLEFKASDEALIKGDVPDVRQFTVDSISYTAHTSRRDGRRCLKVSYFCGYHVFNEYILMEHGGQPQRRAMLWWHEHTPHAPPRTVEEAVARSSTLRAPHAIRVWLNKKYPEVLCRLFA